MRIRSFAAAAAMALLTVNAATAQTPAAPAGMTPAQIETVRTEAKAAVDNYYSLFSAHKMSELPKQSFTIPWIQLGANGPQFNTTAEEALGRFEASLKGLVASGWGKSVFTTDHVCVLNAGVAIVSGNNTRYRTDGSVMSVGGVIYVLSKTGEGWKIISYTGGGRDRVVRCD